LARSPRLAGLVYLLGSRQDLDAVDLGIVLDGGELDRDLSGASRRDGELLDDCLVLRPGRACGAGLVMALVSIACVVAEVAPPVKSSSAANGETAGPCWGGLDADQFRYL
jgi:hypothetical protein